MADEFFELRADLLVEEIDGECLVLDMHQNVYFGLEDVGLLIWRCLEGASSREQILTKLMLSYPGEPRERLAADLDAFLGSLLEANLITPKAP